MIQEITSAILFLTTTGMFLAYIPVVFAVYLKDIDNLDVLRSVAIISLFFFILLGHLSLEICTEWTETGRVALHFGTTLWVVLNRLAAMISGKNVRMNGKITLNVCTTRNWYEMRLICAKTNFEASIYRRWCRGVLHNIVIISAK